MRQQRKRPHGEIRQSQVITTFGPGAMTDLPRHSVLIGGLDYWFGSRDEISEPRLARKLAKILEVPTVRLETPPPADDDPTPRRAEFEFFSFRNGSLHRTWTAHKRTRRHEPGFWYTGGP